MSDLKEEFKRATEREKRRKRVKRLAFNLLGGVIFLALWEIAPRLIDWLNPSLFPPPSKVAQSLIPLIVSGELWTHIVASMERAIAGFAIGVVVGVVAGVSSARLEWFNYLTEPILHGFRAVPVLAIVPIVVLWFGIGEPPKVALIAWGAFFPVWITTLIGVRDVNQIYLKSAASLGASRSDTLFLVVLPAALPFILTGIRQAIALSLVVLVAAELSGSLSGIAYMMSLGNQLFYVEWMFIGIGALGASGFIADRVFVFVTRKAFPWYNSQN
ncbi:MAG: ABC transporter permease [Helicobacteraceae bacterium]|jgi:NitT/TauT family transport system permease protein/sulfonate transport system permease protein|nr:ABC transporter permease [Helicobacteraceae bacterium]